MNNTHSVVLYRNPLEQAIWESVMSGPWLFYITVFLVVFFGTMMLSDKLLNKAVGWNNVGYVHLAVGALCGAAAVWALWI